MGQAGLSACVMATVVNIHHKAKFDVGIVRGTDWGNPYMVDRDGDRAQVVGKYEVRLRKRLKTKDTVSRNLFDKLRDLNGCVLGCYCKPLLCHGDVLVYYSAWAATNEYGAKLPPKKFQPLLESRVGLWKK